jgi:antitoxin (DNA-binding transcriptional repressor) of toxin-antitoxin stability system
MAIFVSKSRFKSQALEYFRKIQTTGEELIITDRKQPVVKMVPYVEDHTEVMKLLRNSVLEYKDPLAPVGIEDWEVLQ